jgi:phenylacetate-CoA oxygenase PaaI subunit
MTEPVPAGAAPRADVEEAAANAAQAAAPVVQRVEAVGLIEPGLRGALYALLSSLADNKYVLGRKYAEWCTGAPMLESAVAAAAMAQDELGHARSFYPLLRGFPEATAADTTEEQGWQDRPTSAMACLDRSFVTWSDFVSANLLVDSALTTLLEAASDSQYEPLRQRARKIVREEEAHWVHAAGWVGRLAADEHSRPSLASSLHAMWDHAFTWFGQADDSVLVPLTGAGLLAKSPLALREQLTERLGPVLESAGLAPELGARSLPWDRWDARARRLRMEI